jgi:hypothetical protein
MVDITHLVVMFYVFVLLIILDSLVILLTVHVIEFLR